MGDCDRNRGLADTARANDRNELLRGELRLDRGDRVFSTNHARQTGGEP